MISEVSNGGLATFKSNGHVVVDRLARIFDSKAPTLHIEIYMSVFTYNYGSFYRTTNRHPLTPILRPADTYTIRCFVFTPIPLNSCIIVFTSNIEYRTMMVFHLNALKQYSIVSYSPRSLNFMIFLETFEFCYYRSLFCLYNVVNVIIFVKSKNSLLIFIIIYSLLKVHEYIEAITTNTLDELKQ